MTNVTVKSSYSTDLIVRLAREIAMDIRELDEILKHYSISAKAWDKIQRSPRFKAVLEQEVTEWNTALNTQERVKVKAGAMLEEWLPELNARLHDKEELLSAKNEAGKLLARLADLGLSKTDVAGAGEKFSVTINLGSDSQLKFEKTAPTVKVIEHEPSEG